MEKQMNIPKLRFSEFSSEWEKKKLGDIAKFTKGKGISKAEISEFGKTECIRYGQLYTYYNEVIYKVISKTDVEVKNLIISEANDVIIPASGETQIDIATASCVLKSGIALGGDLNIIKTNNNGVFLSYYLNNKKKIDIANLAQGISVVHLYSSQLALLNLNLPSVPEQNKIASLFTSIADKLFQMKKMKNLLEQYKKGVMQKLFSQELRFKDENGADFAVWKEKKLGDVGEIITGKTPSTTNLDLWDGDIQFVTPTDINENKYQNNTQRTIKELSKTKILPSKSIMFTCIASIGKMSLSIKPCITNQQINSIVPFKDIDNEYLYYAILNMVDFIKSTQSTNTLPIINKTDFSKFRIFIPSLPEQTKIANFLSAIDANINHCGVQIEKMEGWKKGLLQRMFI